MIDSFSSQLGEYIEVISGFAFKSKLFGRKGMPLIRIRDIKRGKTETFYSGDYHNRFLINTGDILIGMDGEFNVDEWNGGLALLNQRGCKISVKSDKLDERFLLHFLPKKLKEIESKTPFVTVKHLSVEKINAIKIDLPTVMEQKRIAGILDKADEIKRKRQETIDISEKLIQSTFINFFGNPINNERAWRTVPLEKYAFLNRGRFSVRPRNDPSCFGGVHPFFQTGDIAKASPYMESASQSLNEKGVKVSRSFPEHTVVMAIVGATIGETAILKREMYCPDSVIGIIPNENTSYKFLQCLLSFWKPVLRANAPGAARQNINLKILNSIPIPLVENRLVKKFDSIFDEIHKTTKDEYLIVAQELLNSLQQKAFKGELTLN